MSSEATRKAFVDAYYPLAKKMERRYGIPALFALAQSALETGWGASKPGNMLFGVKCTANWQGTCQQLLTTEYVSGQPQRVYAWFRSYPTPQASYEDWAGNILQLSRYRAAMQFRNDPYQFAREVAAAGYATAPQYYQALAATMDRIAPLMPGTSWFWPAVLGVAGALAIWYGPKLIGNGSTQKPE